MAADNDILLRILGKFEHVDERFDKLEEGQREIRRDVSELKSGQARLERRMDRMEGRLGRVERKVDAIAEQTAHFMEFETETRERLDTLEAARVSAK
jgi:chromosome segregation ATPase